MVDSHFSLPFDVGNLIAIDQVKRFQLVAGADVPAGAARAHMDDDPRALVVELLRLAKIGALAEATATAPPPPRARRKRAVEQAG